MNTHLSLGSLITAVGLALTAAPASSAADATPIRFIDADSAEARPIRDTGERAIDRLAYTMVSEIAASVARDGAVTALAGAHLKGLPSPGGFVAGMPRITAMKLTSLRLRNPANAPDAAEQLALNEVQAALESGIPPKVLVQRLDLPNGGHEWRVYKPLAVLRQCVACHGVASEQSPDLVSAVKAQFPNDQASGYSVGQWRGLIRVTVAEPSPTLPPAKVLPASAATHAKKG